MRREHARSAISDLLAVNDKYKGSDFRLRVKIAGSYYLLDGETSTGGTVTQEAVDTTDKAVMPWRELTAHCGMMSMSIKVSGFTASSASVSAIKSLFAAAFYGDAVTVQLVSLVSGEVFGEGDVNVVSMQRGGDKNNAETYDLTIESAAAMAAGVIVLKVATPVFSPSGGAVLTTDFISITCATAGAAIWYTLDGSTPVTHGGNDSSKVLAVFPFDSNSAVPTYGAVGNFSDNFYAYAGYSSGTISGNEVVCVGGSKALGATLTTPVNSHTWSILFSLAANVENGTILSAVALLASSGTSTGRLAFAPYASTGFHLRVNNADKGAFGTATAADGTKRYFAFLLETDGVSGQGRARLYENGILVSTLLFTQETGGQTAYSVGFSGDNAASCQWDNLILTTEIVSTDVISAHAAGQMPDGSGNIGGTSHLYTVPFTLPASSLADPTKWVGVYTTTSLAASNAVTGAPGSALYGISGTAFSQGDTSTSLGSTSTITGRHGFDLNVGVTDWTLFAFMRGDGTNTSADVPYLGIGVPSSAEAYMLFNTYTNQLQYGALNVVGTGSLWITDNVFRHYAFVYDSAASTMTCYRDGVVFSTLTGIVIVGTPPSIVVMALSGAKGFYKNIGLTREKLSTAAIAYLASSGMPSSSGALAGGSTTAKAIGTKAGLIDSDIATATYTVTSANLVNPASWIGAYDFSADPSPNIVTGAGAGTMAGASGATIAGGKMVFNGSGQDGNASASTPYTKISFACFITFPIGNTTQLYISPAGAGGPRCYTDAAAFFDPSFTGISGYANPAILDGAQHHYAWTYNLTTGALLVYIDGSLSQTLSGSTFTSQNASALRFHINTGTDVISIDNVVWYSDILSATAVSALAAGHMPNSSGVLS